MESIEDKKNELEKIQDVDFWKDKYQRLLADFDNYKKRVRKEKDDVSKSVKVSIIENIMDLYNDFKISMKFLEKSESEKFNIILKKFDNWLYSIGIEVIETDTYNPDKHEVIAMVDGDESGIIKDVVSVGWTLNGEVIKYSKIILTR